MNTARLRIYAAAFCMDATAYGAGLLLPIKPQKSFHANPLELGLIGTTINATYTIVCILTGRLSDRVGSRSLYLPGAALVFAAALPIVYFSDSLADLYLAAPVLGVGLGFYWAPLEREMGEASGPRNLWKTAGTFNCVWAAGICMGCLLGPGLYDQLDFKAGVILLLALSGSALALLALPLRIEPGDKTDELKPVEAAPNSARLLLVHGSAVSSPCAGSTAGIILQRGFLPSSSRPPPRCSRSARQRTRSIILSSCRCLESSARYPTR